MHFELIKEEVKFSLEVKANQAANPEESVISLKGDPRLECYACPNSSSCSTSTTLGLVFGIGGPPSRPSGSGPVSCLRVSTRMSIPWAKNWISDCEL